jgi:hypothetical protein
MDVRPYLHPRESSDNPRLNAFCRVAPSLRLRLLATFFAGVLLRAADFNARTSALVQERRFEFLLAIYDSPNRFFLQPHTIRRSRADNGRSYSA